MNLYRIVLASLLPFCQAWRVEVEPFENIPMYSKQNLTFKLEMENGMYCILLACMHVKLHYFVHTWIDADVKSFLINLHR